jgi:hypothetical protein
MMASPSTSLIYGHTRTTHGERVSWGEESHLAVLREAGVHPEPGAHRYGHLRVRISGALCARAPRARACLAVRARAPPRVRVRTRFPRRGSCARARGPRPATVLTKARIAVAPAKARAAVVGHGHDETLVGVCLQRGEVRQGLQRRAGRREAGRDLGETGAWPARVRSPMQGVGCGGQVGWVRLRQSRRKSYGLVSGFATQIVWNRIRFRDARRMASYQVVPVTTNIVLLVGGISERKKGAYLRDTYCARSFGLSWLS